MKTAIEILKNTREKYKKSLKYAEADMSLTNMELNDFQKFWDDENRRKSPIYKEREEMIKEWIRQKEQDWKGSQKEVNSLTNQIKELDKVILRYERK